MSFQSERPKTETAAAVGSSDLVRPPIKPGMLVTLRQAYSPDIRKGTVCEVEAMRKDRNCASGFRVRVGIPGNKYSRYFDAGWFDEYHAWRSNSDYTTGIQS